jgi:uncharacterized protein (TIGR03663 family)
VGTASTKRARKNRQTDWGATTSAGASGSEVAEPPTPDAGRPDRVWMYGSLAVLMAATLLRLYALELKPMHHDEGVNGFFLTTLLRSGAYKYDPTNYHGPVLYYLTLPAVVLMGLTTFAVRFVIAVAGIATVWLVLSLRRYVGSLGALAAAALVAVSPGAVFYSRYFIHETLFVFFTLGIVVAALRFYETRQGWYLMMLAASAAMLFATKETAFISAGVLILAALVSWAWARLRGAAKPPPPGGARDKRRAKKGEGELSLGALREGFGSPERVALLVGGALALFVGINVLFYSSFFTNWPGVGGAVEALAVWKKTGTSDFHSKPFHTYLTWLWQEEAPILILATAGAAAALFERRVNRFAVFAGAWAFGTLAAYSLIPYKTPWLAINFIIPMAVIGGYALQLLTGRTAPSVGARGRHVAALALGALALGVCLYQSVVINFRKYDDDTYPYVYSHTQREAHQLLAEVERIAGRAGKPGKAGISVTSRDYWPLPWYFRDNTHVGYEGKVSTYYDPQSTLVVIGNESQLPELQRVLADGYRRVGGVYPLRPGVRLVLFARRDLIAP